MRAGDPSRTPVVYAKLYTIYAAIQIQVNPNQSPIFSRRMSQFAVNSKCSCMFDSAVWPSSPKTSCVTLKPSAESAAGSALETRSSSAPFTVRVGGRRGAAGGFC